MQIENMWVLKPNYYVYINIYFPNIQEYNGKEILTAWLWSKELNHFVIVWQKGCNLSTVNIVWSEICHGVGFGVFLLCFVGFF